MRGPSDAMSALDPAFHDAYVKAAAELLAAVMEFERATGRIVDGIELQTIDVTQLQNTAPQYVRHAAIKFLPTPGDVAY